MPTRKRALRIGKQVAGYSAAAILAALLFAPPLWAQPRNLGNTESPVSARCVTADGTAYESCGGSGAGDGKILDGTAAGQADVMGSAPTGTEQGLVTRNIPSGTQQVSATSLPLPTGAATEASLSSIDGKIPASPATDRATAAAPFSFRLSDGAAFYKATTPSDTQPVSGTITAQGQNSTVPVYCDSVARYNAATSGSTELVALTASQTIYVCGWSAQTNSATGVNVKLIYGTGTACATGATDITMTRPLDTDFASGFVDNTVTGNARKTAASNALCINTSGAVQVYAEVLYTKF